MYDVENVLLLWTMRLAFAKLDAYIYIYGPVTKWRHWGMFIHWGTNFAFPQTLYSSEYHRRSFLRSSDTCACHV